MQTTKKVTRVIGIISIATAISRVLGYVRDSLNAGLFGAGIISDAYFIAYRIPNILRDLFAEGALSSAFIPTFTEYLAKDKKKEAYQLANAFFNLLIIFFSILVIIGILTAPFIVRIVAPGVVSSAFFITVKLTRILFPFIAFMGFAALFMGILNSNQKFTIPALAPALLNIVMIIFGIFICPIFKNAPEKQVVIWSIGTLIGGFAQFIIQIPLATKLGFRFKLTFALFNKGVKKILKLISPMLFANSVNYINVIIVNTAIASLFGSAVITYLYYGFRLLQLPMGLFGVAVSTSIFPLLSWHFAKDDINSFRETFSYGLKLIFFLTIPSAIGLAVLSKPITSLLFQHGKFTSLDALNTSYVTVYYSIGLIALAGTKLTIRAFYSLNNATTPVKVGLITIVINVLLSIILSFKMSYYGLALANSIAAIFNFSVLLWILRKHIKRINGKEMLVSFLKILLVSVIMACGVLTLKTGYVLADIIIGITIFLGFSYLFRIKELYEFAKIFKKQNKGN